MIEGNCFKKWLNFKSERGIASAEYLTKEEKEEIESKGKYIPPITKVMMNPPFAKTTSEDREYKFIEQALKQMRDEGLLFSILPKAVMVKQGSYLDWRKNSLLKENTLLCVIDFAPDLFYPTGIETCGIIVKKGIPHKSNQKVLWIKIREDGFVKSKGKRLPSERARNQLEDIKPLVKDFIKNQQIKVSDIKEFLKICPIDLEDKNLELLPEVYLDEKMPTEDELKNRIEYSINDAISLMVKFGKMDYFKKEVLLGNNIFSKSPNTKKTNFKEIPITDLFITPIKTGEYHVSGILDEGEIPLVSCVSENGGFEGFFSAKNPLKNAITISCDGMPLTSFYHYYPFVAKDNVLLCKPNKKYRFTTLLFITAQINSLRWRFSYGRKCYENKVHKIKIFLPFDKENNLDEDYIETLFKNTHSWKILEKLFS